MIRNKNQEIITITSKWYTDYIKYVFIVKK